MQPVDTFTHEGIDCAIYVDEDAGNPYVEWDQASRLLLGPALAREYDFGQYRRGLDAHATRSGMRSVETFTRLEEFSSLAAAARYLRLMEGYAVVIPFTFHDYGSGGTQVRATHEGDDRAAGFVVVDRETVAREWPEATTIDGETFTRLEMAERCARAELEVFAQYVAGDVYGYVVAVDSPEHDSCWGFYGTCERSGETDAHGAAREAAEHAATERAERIRMERVYLLDPVAIDKDAYYARARLEYLRGELRAERISLGELIELQNLVPHIEPGDFELLEAAGVPEEEAMARLYGAPAGGGSA